MGDPPKKPRASSVLSPSDDEERDKRKTSAPPVGSPLDKLRREIEARRAGDGIPLEYQGDNKTPVKMQDTRSPVQKIEERSKRAADHSEDAALGIALVREEFGGRIGALERTTENMDGKLDVIMLALPAALQAGTLTLTAKLEVDKAKEISAVEVEKTADVAQIEVGKELALEPTKALAHKRDISKVVVGGLVTAIVSLVGAVVYLLTH